MDRSKLQSNVSIIIVNSSDSDLDGVKSVLQSKIESGQRPFIACLTSDRIGQASNPQDFVWEFISEQLEKCQITMEKSQQIESFNQLESWKKEIEMRSEKKQPSSSRIKGGIKNQLGTERDGAQKIIVDFPPVHESIKLYLILFDVYECGIIKSLASIDSSLIAIVHLHPRGDKKHAIKSEAFWEELLREKHTKAFERVAFLDLDVPVESAYMLSLRSHLIYDQFCHLFYDIEDIKSRYKKFYERLVIAEINVDSSGDEDGLRKRLDEIPESMMTVEAIYAAIVDQISAENGSRKSSLRKRFAVDIFEKKFCDVNDEWRDAFDKSPDFYAAEVEKLESSLRLWDDFEKVSVEKRQLLNFFMGKLMKILGNDDEFEHLEFYIYTMQLKRMSDCKVEMTEKDYFENRSVGHKRTMKTTSLKPAVSDIHVDYRNQPKIPVEIFQLTDDTAGDSRSFYVSMFSPSAMIQHLTSLKKRHHDFTYQHSHLMDVLLIKFHRRAIPKLFVTRSFSKVLPTPLCFRDFNDFVEPEIEEEKIDDAGGDARPCGILSDDFILTSSLKHRLKVQEDKRVETPIEITTANDEKVAEPTIQVYNVSNSRSEFHVTESKFNSAHVSAKASNFNWLHHQKILNYSCQLHDVHLSIAHDFTANKLQSATLTDSFGMKCSVDAVADGSPRPLNGCNFLISFPNGLSIRNLDDGAIEQRWFEKQSPDGESKRILFSNGFVLVSFADETTKVFASNGSIFETSKRASVGLRRTQKDQNYDEKATKAHRDSIASIHFLKDIVGFSSFKMTVPSGEVFNVENDLIRGKLETRRSVEKLDKGTGNLYIARDDGVRILFTKESSKCRFPDGTLITTCLRDDSIVSATDEPEMSSSILDEIWLSEARNDSQFVVNHVLNHIPNHFLNINRTHQIEHQHYGAVRFGQKMEIKTFNGTSLQAHSDRFLMTLKDDITFDIDDWQLRLRSKTCSECFSFSEIFMNFLSTNDDDNKVLLATSDIDSNAFEIKKNGRQAFYERNIYDTQKCSQCCRSKGEFEEEKFGERWIVLNRDYSGYEISKSKQTAAFEELFGHKKFLFSINDSDVNIDIDKETTPPSVTNVVVRPRESTESTASSTKGKQKRRKSKKSISKDSASIQPLIEVLEPSPWLTEKPSIPDDIPSELRNLIQFYDNPLSEFPETCAVGPMIELNKFGAVVNALLHLKTYSSSTFIFNVSGLMETPVGKKTYEDNFKSFTRKTVEKHIEAKMECYRRLIAEAVLDDLLAAVMETERKIDLEMKTISVETNVIQVDSDVSLQPPVAIKSFSFS